MSAGHHAVVVHDETTRIGFVEIDRFEAGDPEVYLEVHDESAFDGKPIRAVVVMTLAEARQIADALNTVAGARG